MQALRQQKQKYLRDQILQKNYDAQEFMEFCQTYKGSVDIDSWTFNELVDIVKAFINSFKKQTESKGADFFSVPEVKSKAHDDQFSDYMNNFLTEKQQKKQSIQQQSFDLNLIDLDFLQGMGGGDKKQKPKQPVKQPVKPMQDSFMMVPGDIAKKLQAGNDNFIVGYKNTSEIPKQSKINNPPSPTKIPSNNNPMSSMQSPRGQTYNQSSQNESFETDIQCRKIISKSSLVGHIQVLVSGHQIINPNVFIPNYVLYTLTINPLNRQVKRRMKDFETFRAILKKLFPTTQIPHLQKYGRLSQTQPHIIKKQKLFIQSFINSLLMNQEIRCKFIDDFILCSDQKLLKKVFKQYEKVEKPKAIEQLFTSSGKIKLKIDPNSKKFIDQNSVFLDSLQNNMTRLKNLYDQIVNNMFANSKLLTEISQIYDGLKQQIRNINQASPPPIRAQSTQKIFESISDLMKQWSLCFKTQAKLMDTEIRHQCRFEQDNTQTLRELIKMHDYVVSQGFLKRSDRNQSDRDSYSSKNLNDYKYSIEAPSRNITVLKYQSAYLQQQTVKEIIRYMRETSQKLNHKFTLFSMLQLNINNDMDNSWKDFEKHAQ